MFVGQFKFAKSQERAMANQRFLLLVFIFMAMINTGLMTEPVTLPRVTRSSASGPGLPKVW